jgi:hypothetical protein
MTSTTTTTLRLSPDLAALARARAESLGVSLNALVAFALDAYLRAPGGAPGGAPGAPAPGAPAPGAPAPGAPAPGAPGGAPGSQTAPDVSKPPMNRAQRRAMKKRK